MKMPMLLKCYFFMVTAIAFCLPRSHGQTGGTPFGIYYGSMRLADVNGDGLTDVCGRGIPGVYCSLNHGDGTFGPAALWTNQFDDANGWNQPQYGTTMMFADINGDGMADVCGRGGAGIYCKLSTGNGFGATFLASSDFSDAGGWNRKVSYYGSIRLADVNGDGMADVCGRGVAGVYCSLNHGDGTFGPVGLWTNQFDDANGWNQPQYGTTMMFADINGDGRADVCGRGGAGIYCKLSAGNGFGETFLASSDFSDAGGWNQKVYYGSIRLADVNGDGLADVCGRGIPGVYCSLNHGDGTFGPAGLWTNQFDDANGWNQPQYGTTMMFADINGDGMADVCGRGGAGIYCKLSTGNGFGETFLESSDFSDAGGWNR